MTRLVDAGLVEDDWKQTPSQGRVTTSLVSFIVRKGNPKGIRTWSDLLKPGVEVLTPNPFTSGAAKWNLLAAYGQAGSGSKGLDYVRELLTKHVKVQDKSGREALQNFTSGNGDVLLSYEYEAITAQKKGQDVDFVTPDDTIRIDIDIATTAKAPPAAQRFVDYVLSEPAQRRFASWGYRPVNQAVLTAEAKRFPNPSGLFTIDDLGGWKRVNKSLFDPRDGSIAKIEEEAGVTTGSERARLPSPCTRAAPRAAAAARLARARRQPDVAERHRPAAARRGGGALGRRRPRRLLGRRVEPSGRRRAALHALASLVAAAINAVAGTLIAWVLVRDAFPGKRVLNALIDLPFALPTIVAGLVLLALYGNAEPGRHQRRLHAGRRRARAAVRDAAVRHPCRAARADRARPRDGGGRGVARRLAAHRVPRASSCPTSARRS